MQSTIDEMISLDFIRIHVKALQGENGMLKNRQVAEFFTAVDPSIIPTSHLHVAYQGLASPLQPG